MTLRLEGRYKKESIMKYHKINDIELKDLSNRDVIVAKIYLINEIFHTVDDKNMVENSMLSKFCKATKRTNDDFFYIIDRLKFNVKANTDVFFQLDMDETKEDVNTITQLFKFLTKVYPSVDFSLNLVDEEKVSSIDSELNIIKSKILISFTALNYLGDNGGSHFTHTLSNLNIGYDKNYLKELNNTVSTLNLAFEDIVDEELSDKASFEICHRYYGDVELIMNLNKKQ